MKLKTLFLITIALILYSCNDSDNNEDIINQTPQALDGGSDYELSSVAKRYDTDIISKLYKEAMDKNTELEELNTQIEDMVKVKYEGLEDYSEYTQANENYWTTVNSYISQLEDSVLRESTLETFQNFQLKYNSNLSGHKAELELINKKSMALNDQLILMKLLVTKPMMQNYQSNEMPNVDDLININNQYEELILEAKSMCNKVSN